MPYVCLPWMQFVYYRICQTMLFLPLTILVQVADESRQSPHLFDVHHLSCFVEQILLDATPSSLYTHLEVLETARNSIPLVAPTFLMLVASFPVRDKAKEVRKTPQWDRKRDESLQREWQQSVGPCSDPEKSVDLSLIVLGRVLVDGYQS